MNYVNSEWINNTTPVGDGIYHSASVTYANNLIVTSKILNGSGDADIVTIKYNSNGDTLWMKTHAGTGDLDDYGIELATTTFGDIVVIGAVQNLSSGYDYIVLRYSSMTGSLMWSYTWNGPLNGMDIPTDLTIDGSDNIYITGGTLDPFGFSNYATIKLSSAGALQWTSFYDFNNLHDSGSKIDIAGSQIIVSGASAESIGSWNLAIVKLNPNSGTIMSSKRTGSGATLVEANAMVTDGDNNVYITGFSETSGFKNVETIKLDSDLNVLWVKNYSDTLNVVVPVIGVPASVTLYINDGIHPPGSYSGNFRTFGYTNYHALNPGDIIVDSWPLNSYTNTLEPGLGGLVGPEKSEFGMGLGAVSLTSAYCFGSVVLVTTNSLGDPITPFWYPHAPDEITKFGYTLHIKTAYAGTNEWDDKVNFSFYPNPTEEFLNLTFLIEDASDVSLVVTDIKGGLVHNEMFNNLTQGQQKRQINVESLSKGVYSIQVTINDKTYYEKFIKQ